MTLFFCRWQVAALLLVLLGFVANSCSANNDRPPNIVLIVADDLGYGELGCYGQQIIKTPNIDRLAAAGMRFTQFYSGSPVCAPSRCTLMTGKHTGHAATRNNGDPKYLQHLKEKYGWEFTGQYPLPDEEVTLAELLKSRGYATAAIGKWGLGHFGTTGDPNKQGIDLFYGFNDQRHAHNHYPRFLWRNRVKEALPGNDRTATGETYSQDKFTEVALEFVRENKDGPFLLYLPFAIPHLAIQVPEKSLAEYLGVIPEEEGDYRQGSYEIHPNPRAGYAAMVSHMDRDVGKIVQLVHELGLDENTLFLFTSDNGPTFDRFGGSDSDFFQSSGPLRGRKGSVYEGGIRVPLIARWPKRIEASSESDHQAAFWDLLPTLCEVADVEPSEGIDGISFAGTLFGKESQAEHEYLYWEFPAYGGQQAIRVGDWKAVRRDIFKGNRKLQLYNLAEDIGEANDLADQLLAKVKSMEQLMVEARVPSELFPLFDRKKK